jgi:hypothetical protein
MQSLRVSAVRIALLCAASCALQHLVEPLLAYLVVVNLCSLALTVTTPAESYLRTRRESVVKGAVGTRTHVCRTHGARAHTLGSA